MARDRVSISDATVVCFPAMRPSRRIPPRSRFPRSSAKLREVAVAGAIDADELEQARASLTRGYVRHFETAAHLARAATALATYDLPADTYDNFVPRILQLTTTDLTGVAQTFLRPDDAALVVVADLDQYRGTLADRLGRPVTETTIEF
jgi:hypothetical protein